MMIMKMIMGVKGSEERRRRKRKRKRSTMAQTSRSKQGGTRGPPERKRKKRVYGGSSSHPIRLAKMVCFSSSLNDSERECVCERESESERV